MVTISSLYRSVVPEAIRDPLWRARHRVWHKITTPLRAFRNSVADYRLKKGRPIASVRIDGLTLNIDLRDDGVGRPLYVCRDYEPLETILLRRLLKPGHVFIDVGANIGYYTTLAARQVGPTGRVLAIEPDPHNYELLCNNIKVNQFNNVLTSNTALSDKPGSAQLFCSTNNFGDHRLYVDGDTVGRSAVTISALPLDELIRKHGYPPADLLKMDVQGFECQVLAGMEETLRVNERLRVLTEFWPNGMRNAGGDPAWFFNTFERLGYSAHPVTGKGVGPQVSYNEVLALLPLFNPEKPDGCYINLLFDRQLK